MDITLYTLAILPIGLGLLGFFEPCTIGGHLIYLRTQNQGSQGEKAKALLAFVVARSLVAGLFGALIAVIGGALVGFQTFLWLAFGIVYTGIGLAFLLGRAGWVKKPLNLAPERWRHAQNPLILGMAFGLNIPACAAPIIFGLLGLAATTGTALTGFVMMFLFGLFLSAPLALFVVFPYLTTTLAAASQKFGAMRWIMGGVFIALGLWSIWFGLYVDPARWA